MKAKLKYFLWAGADLDEDQVEAIIKCFKPVPIKKNGILLCQGDVCKELYFVAEGCARIYYADSNGGIKTRFVAFERTLFTAISSFITQKPSTEIIEAIEDSLLFAISYKNFFRLVKEIPEWAKFYQRLLEAAYLYQNEKIEQMVTCNARRRYEKLLIEKPYYVTRLSNKNLASFLNITQETLSRLKSK
jgi:CRP-like cAMP-binding protein